MKTTITVSAPVKKSARVLQMAGMFDLPVETKSTLSLDVNLPLEEKPWHVGLIVGPSGSGKSTIAQHLWPDNVLGEQTWSSDAALLDDFPAGLGIQDITGLLTAVGLGSPPAWVRPHRTLSNGEAFRASIARAIADTDELIVVDEFTSVVDRQVAQVASHTIQKTIRRADRQFIAVTCHYDIEEWLQPDWIYDVAAGIFTWRQVQPHPRIELTLHKTDSTLWPVFRRHHYLSAELNKAAQCFVAWADGKPVAFTSYLHFPHWGTRNIKMAHRIVVLPDYQGLGIAGRLSEWCGQYLYAQGYRYRIATSHPAMIRYHSKSPRWADVTEKGKTLRTRTKDPGMARRQLDPRRLAGKSFEYRPPVTNRDV